jgi:hypothetical protein
MQQIKCRCGNVINLSAPPVEGEFAYFPGEHWDSVVNELVSAVSGEAPREEVLLRESLHDALAVEVSYFYRCSQCERLIMRHNDTGKVAFFMAERDIV